MSRLLRALTPLIAFFLMLPGCGGNAPVAPSAAVVNGESVPSARYQLLVSSAQRRIESSGLSVDWNAAQGRSQLRQIQAQALQLAVRDTVIEQQARRRGIGVGVGDLDEAVTALEGLAGGPDQLDQRLEMEGMSRADYRALLRYTLLDRKLRAADVRWDEHLAAAVRAAGVQAFVGPCETDHRYPRCVDER